MEKILTDVTLEPIGGEGLGPFGNNAAKSGTEAMTQVTGAISAIIGLLTVAAVIWFLFQFTIGGISWMTAAGEKNKLTEARERLTNAFVGLVIVISGWAILALAGQFFGWTTIIRPEDVIDKIKF